MFWNELCAKSGKIAKKTEKVAKKTPQGRGPKSATVDFEGRSTPVIFWPDGSPMDPRSMEPEGNGGHGALGLTRRWARRINRFLDRN